MRAVFGRLQPHGRRFLGVLAGFALAAGAGHAQVQPWNLPYVRPAAYDYKALYGTSLADYLTRNPGYIRDQLKLAWGYYKTNFIMSNGLVNHRRLVNGSLTGANEAVSEGQGYGMLLSVIMNDQATFNRIFEAANTNMWDAGRKSYFVWTWPGSGTGAASDADLDIGLSLIFADQLQKKSLWTAYNKSGITYQSRAMEILRSIRTNMTAQNYLLPGDNWGGDGINNLNPGYFAPAWFKVFNAYQKEVDFAPVIETSYQVLAKMPRYNVGQAPDWCTAQGAQASQAGSKPEQGLGMLSDAIRTPWRIATDAIWFNEARAIAYCKNTKGTLTEYANTTNLKAVAAQMAHYNKAGTSIVDTRGSFDNVAMWTSGVLGSKETAYTQKVLNTTIIGLIVGSSADHFGDQSLQDQQFYYKQSISMLGLALIGGQFPNIMADEMVAVSVNPFLKPQSAKTSIRAVRGSTPLWLTSEGVPGISGTGLENPVSPVYRNALGQAALPLH